MSETDNVKQPNDPLEDVPTTPTSASEAPPAAESAAAPETNASPEAALAAARQEAAAAQDRYLRSLADLENIRRRHVREKDELRAFAAARVVEELLPVLDNLGLGLAAAKAPNADLNTLVGGIEMVATQLKAALANHGLKEINPVGQPFDPNLHEAISQQPNTEVPEEHVVQVVRTGYTLNGRLLRPASVVISGGAVEEAKR